MCCGYEDLVSGAMATRFGGCLSLDRWCGNVLRPLCALTGFSAYSFLNVYGRHICVFRPTHAV